MMSARSIPPPTAAPIAALAPVERPDDVFFASGWVEEGTVEAVPEAAGGVDVLAVIPTNYQDISNSLRCQSS